MENSSYVYFEFFRNSYRRCSIQKDVLKNFANFTGKYLCQSFFLIKLWTSACNFVKKRLWHRCFPNNFAKFLRVPFLQNTSGRLLLVFHVIFVSMILALYDQNIAQKSKFSVKDLVSNY